MITRSANKQTVTKAWHLVDADNAILGRMASEIASVLRGKHKPIYTPHVDTGDFVVVLNASKVKLTGKKEEVKRYHHYTGYPGGERSIAVKDQRKRFPERIIMHAVKGMLPKGPLGRKMLKKLKVYGGDTHPHMAQQPQPLTFS